MSNKKPLRRRLLYILVRGRFEPVESIVAASGAVHGLWLLFPYWQLSGFFESITGAPRVLEQILGAWLAVPSVLHLLAMALTVDATPVNNIVRRTAAFSKFIAWSFLGHLAIFTAGVDSIIWIPYLTLALLSGTVYLNMSLGVWYRE